MEDIDTDHLVNVLCDPAQDVKTEAASDVNKQGNSNTTFFNDETKATR